MNTFLSKRITLGLVTSMPVETVGIWFSLERKYNSKYLAEKKKNIWLVYHWIIVLSEKLVLIHFS